MVILFTNQELTVAFKTATLVKKKSLMKKNQNYVQNIRQTTYQTNIYPNC